jgi:hypothetical protein
MGSSRSPKKHGYRINELTKDGHLHQLAASSPSRQHIIDARCAEPSRTATPTTIKPVVSGTPNVTDFPDSACSLTLMTGTHDRRDWQNAVVTRFACTVTYWTLLSSSRVSFVSTDLTKAGLNDRKRTDSIGRCDHEVRLAPGPTTILV